MSGSWWTCKPNATHNRSAGSNQTRHRFCGCGSSKHVGALRLESGSRIVGLRESVDKWANRLGAKRCHFKAGRLATDAYRRRMEGEPLIPWCHRMVFIVQPAHPAHVSHDFVVAVGGCGEGDESFEVPVCNLLYKRQPHLHGIFLAARSRTCRAAPLSSQLQHSLDVIPSFSSERLKHFRPNKRPPHGPWQDEPRRGGKETQVHLSFLIRCMTCHEHTVISDL
jgi:hypothetical protein